LETDEDKYSFGNPLIIKCREVLRVGDVISYYHEFWGNQRKVVKIQKIKPDKDTKLVLETNDVLQVTCSVKRIKKQTLMELKRNTVWKQMKTNTILVTH
jgi:hypothetical protein